MRTAKIQKVRFFQCAAEQDLTLFPTVSPFTPLTCNLDALINYNEFNKDCPDVFSYSTWFERKYPLTLPVLSLESRTATALILSDRFIDVFSSVVSEIHSSSESKVRVDLMTSDFSEWML